MTTQSAGTAVGALATPENSTLPTRFVAQNGCVRSGSSSDGLDDLNMALRDCLA
jgi:hypothetical protein